MQTAGIYDSDVIQGAVLCGSLETDGAMIYDQTFFKFEMKSKKQIQKKNVKRVFWGVRIGVHQLTAQD